ncbi:hypothetical protein [Patulibacter defluvii]|uniref:hypothetical protein n=1 Tax=Patulibacter defluvii TaxID=3095358 RepID=UPI002A7558E9|nr:hypothetical protein [Patulibacter sp. DM4]
MTRSPTPLGSRRRRSLLGAGAAGSAAIVALAGAAPAGAATAPATYPTPVQAQNFDGGLGNWVGSSEYSGLCLIPILLCTGTSSGHTPTGGDGPKPASQSGFAYSGFLSLASVTGVATGILTSPGFVYNGVGGKTPWKLQFSLSRRANVQGLLQLGTNVYYTVQILRAADSAVVATPVAGVPVKPLAGWTPMAAPIEIDPGTLKVGEQYKIRIRTTLEGGVNVGPLASFDYDNVVLKALPVPGPGEPGGPGLPGTNGKDGTPGEKGQKGSFLDDVGLTKEEVEKVLFGPNASATLRGRYLTIRLSLPKKAKVRARTRDVGYVRRGKFYVKATTTTRVNVSPGQTKSVRLYIRKAQIPKMRPGMKTRISVFAQLGFHTVSIFRDLRIKR